MSQSPQQDSSPEPLNWGATIQESLEADNDEESHVEPNPAVEHPSYLAFCKRQALLAKLGLKDNSDILGIFKTGTLIHEWLESNLCLDDVHQETAVEMTINGITLTGTADLFDPQAGLVVDFKSRGGWHRFDPPSDRHLNQLTLYMGMVGAPRGRIAYINKKDLEVRAYPEDGFIEFDEERFWDLIDKAKDIRDTLILNGVPTCEEEVPFDHCGCFLCSQESLDFSDPPELEK
jgi:CRISPR-associated exonuclease Cas4